ncbi:hypothetical protein WL1483_3127 [Aeromonas schubertii]|uniref:Uncharacterized protein n=1 Tax=Aeromonas schubertii TaxID=652 RepID=A0A0S2SLK4_9GAMM|nr:hypothetical protein WL1483_3127 [Aeromonas schubertii]
MVVWQMPCESRTLPGTQFEDKKTISFEMVFLHLQF